jgi:hypothetical protein
VAILSWPASQHGQAVALHGQVVVGRRDVDAPVLDRFVVAHVVDRQRARAV